MPLEPERRRAIDSSGPALKVWIGASRPKSSSITPKAAAPTRSSPRAAITESISVVRMPPAHMPRVLTFGLAPMSPTASTRSKQVCTYSSRPHAAFSLVGLRQLVTNMGTPRDTAYSTKLRCGARSMK